MNIVSRHILCFFAVVSLSACESLKSKDDNVFDSSSVEMQRSKIEVKNNMSSSPSVSEKSVAIEKNEVISDGSVEIFDMELNPDYRRGVPPSMAVSPVVSQKLPERMPVPQPAIQPAPQLPVAPIMEHGQTIRTGDSSVTVYGLDGDVIPYPYPVVESAEHSYGVAGVSNYDPTYNQSYDAVAGQIFFKHGSSRLGSGDMRKISNLAEKAKFAPVNYVTVEGFASKPTQAGTDTTQAHIINLRQSMKRSEKVSKALVSKGVPGDKIKTVSWGASKATGNNSRDRRVDIVMGEK